MEIRTDIPKVGVEHFEVTPYLADFQGRLTMTVLGNFLLHTAAMHAEQRGFGIEEMNAMNRTWVLSRLAIQIDRYPKKLEHFSIETWIEDCNRLFTQRNFAFVDADGNDFGYARSIWAAMDITTRRPTNLSILEEFRAFFHDRHCPIDGPSKQLAVNGVLARTYSVKYSDLDINSHHNSIRYIEHACDLYSKDRYAKQQIRRFDISFINESAFGDRIDLITNALSESSEQIEFRKNATEAIARVKVEFIDK